MSAFAPPSDRSAVCIKSVEGEALDSGQEPLAKEPQASVMHAHRLQVHLQQLACLQSIRNVQFERGDILSRWWRGTEPSQRAASLCRVCSQWNVLTTIPASSSRPAGQHPGHSSRIPRLQFNVTRQGCKSVHHKNHHSHECICA